MTLAPELGGGVVVLGEGPGWIAVAKPAGLPVIPTREDPGAPTLKARVAAALGEDVLVVHRLDRDTSGVVVLARDPGAHRRLGDAFAGRRARKTYLAVCRRGRDDAGTAGRIDLALVPGRKGGMRGVAPGTRPPGARDAVTRFRVVALRGDLAVVEAHPETGRTHQIRVHLAAAGWPLAVDPRYGDPGPVTGFGARCGRLTLHARRLVVPGAGLDVTAPVPDDLGPLMATVLQRPLD